MSVKILVRLEKCALNYFKTKSKMNLPAASYGVSKGKDFYIETPSASQTLAFGYNPVASYRE